MRGFGFNNVQTQLLTVPVYIRASIFYLTIAFFSNLARCKVVFMVPLALITAMGYATMLGLDMSNTTVLYLATFVTATGIYCCIDLNITWKQQFSNAGYYQKKRLQPLASLQQTVGNSAGDLAVHMYSITDSEGRDM